MSNIIFPQVNNEQLLKEVKKYVGNDEIEHVSIGCAIGDDPEILTKVVKNMVEKRFFGPESINNVFISKPDKEISTSNSLIFRTFEFNNEKMVQFNYRYPQDIAMELFFLRKGKSHLIEQLILEYRKLKKKATKEISEEEILITDFSPASSSHIDEPNCERETKEKCERQEKEKSEAVAKMIG